MTRFGKMTRRSFAGSAATLAMLSCFAAPALAQEAITPHAEIVRIETETVTVTRAAAFPSQIARKPGPFFLELKTQVPDPGLNLVWVAVVPVADPSKLAKVLDVPALQKKKRSVGLVDLPPGVYQLQVQPNGKTICTISIGE